MRTRHILASRLAFPSRFHVAVPETVGPKEGVLSSTLALHFSLTDLAFQGWDAPYLYKDVFNDFVSQHISVNRTFWNNLSKDFKFVKPGWNTDGNVDEFKELSAIEKQSVESAEDCAEACRYKDECIQWMWQPDRCHLGKDIRLGSSDEQEKDENNWYSGWMLDRVEDMRAELEPCLVKWTDDDD